ncbi:Receptor-like kinase LIP2 [Linum perenne]
MVWLLGLSCFGMNQNGGAKKNETTNSENHKAWLLAESGGGGAVITTSNTAEPQSVHSSFRFSFCSQVELDSMNIPSASSATVLMVNLDNGLGKELGWRRIQSLERSISPVANSLVWFHYSEILAATRTFSQGRVLGRGALSYVFRGRVGLLRSCVAIKRLDKEDKESSEAFCRELMIAISLHHPNVVPLLGFCIDPEEGLFLVYKYASGGSLERHLHGHLLFSLNFLLISFFQNTERFLIRGEEEEEKRSKGEFNASLVGEVQGCYWSCRGNCIFAQWDKEISERVSEAM